MKLVYRAFVMLVVLFAVGVLAVASWAWAPDLPRHSLVERYADGTSRFPTLASGVQVHLRDEGCETCPPVVLIHGSNASLHTWEDWADQLGENWRVVSIDMPGHGLTGETSDGDYTIERAAQIVEEVRQYLELGDIHLAGNSRGGRISLTYAVTYPDHLLSLGLLNASGAPWEETEDEDGTPFIYALIDNPSVARALKNFLPRSLVEEALRDAYTDQSVVTEALLDRYMDLLRHPGNREATLLRNQMPYSTAAFEQAGTITAPVQIMWGEDDNLVPVSAAYQFAEAIAHAESVIYPGVGHVPMEEIAEQSATDYEAFLVRAQQTANPIEIVERAAHRPGVARFGYYMPMDEFRVGDYQLRLIFMDEASRVDAWIDTDANGDIPPVMIQFDDTASEWVEYEIGGGYARYTLATPGRYAVTPTWFEFQGMSEALGPVSFRGRYSPETVDAAMEYLATEEIVLEGRLTIGDQVWEEARFSWYGGD